MKRARSTAEKRERAGALLGAARELLGEERFASVSVEGITRRAGVAKGTFFLYFPTKESLGLALLEEFHREWQADLEARLRALADPASPGTVAAAVRRSLEGRAEMVSLLALLGSVLEGKVPVEGAEAFRRGLLGRARQVGGALEARLPFLRPGEGVEVALMLHALVIGIHEISAPAESGAARRPELGIFRVDLPGAVGRMLRVHLEGLRAMGMGGSAPGQRS